MSAFILVGALSCCIAGSSLLTYVLMRRESQHIISKGEAFFVVFPLARNTQSTVAKIMLMSDKQKQWLELSDLHHYLVVASAAAHQVKLWAIARSTEDWIDHVEDLRSRLAARFPDAVPSWYLGALEDKHELVVTPTMAH